jgi:hypothetical protein
MTRHPWPGSRKHARSTVPSTLAGGQIDPARPQALVSQRTAEGRLQLGAVEYIVLQADRDATHAVPPSLLGQSFMLMPADNRFGLPPFYQLHAWVWQDNPSGMFSMWNPAASCSPNSA